LSNNQDKVFAGSVPTLYDEYLVPLIFDAYAHEMAARVRATDPSRVLEIAAGSGAVTRALASALPAGTAIVATDFNQPMLDRAQLVGTSREVQWRWADAMDLPFPDESFDAVVCQFGAMFFPDRPKAFAEARRVLKRGGIYLLSVWDRIEDNEFADAVTQSLESIFPDDPPRFLARTPHGYSDPHQIESDLIKGGFPSPHMETVAMQSRAASARIVAMAYCEGTPVRDEIVARDPALLDKSTDVAEKAIAERWGTGPVDAKMQAHIITAIKE
jgi:SAM-dependent methyltransferase